MQAAPQIVPFAVVADRPDGVECSRAERRQIVHDRSRGAGICSNLRDLVGGLPGLDARLRKLRVGFEILVEKEIAEDGNSPRRETIEKFVEPFNFHGENAQESERMTTLGMTPMEAIIAATSSAARLLGLEREIGSIEPGKRADLVFVEGNPLHRIGLLMKKERLVAVMRNGRFVAGNL